MAEKTYPWSTGTGDTEFEKFTWWLAQRSGGYMWSFTVFGPEGSKKEPQRLYEAFKALVDLWTPREVWSGTIEMECPTCHAQFKVTPQVAPSKPARDKVSCATCGKEFEVQQGRSDEGVWYCSPPCIEASASFQKKLIAAGANEMEPDPVATTAPVEPTGGSVKVHCDNPVIGQFMEDKIREKYPQVKVTLAPNERHVPKSAVESMRWSEDGHPMHWCEACRSYHVAFYQKCKADHETFARAIWNRLEPMMAELGSVRQRLADLQAALRLQFSKAEMKP